ncbi:Hypothetical predicted protein [Mytilus galloprovincialis]|uniref:Reverse transcriptase domain-containing protein n=1 Tax=Mytilus galloprovincialis TaxID=29158 RepID=A0A8B6CPM5_MYTGA|nr:Hypothetical predicted protein [Mytilus galloprovincialis]
MSIQVKWNNSLSGEVKVTQGVRQGAKLSTMLYKRYNNNILKALERSDIGAEIGNIKVTAPTCADDIAVLAENQHEVQALLDIVENCTKRDLVTINQISQIWYRSLNVIVISQYTLEKMRDNPKE